MARSITYREAINEAIAQEMERDERVIVMGEDNAGGAGSPGEDDAWGGVLGVTKGLYGRFPGRVLDTPISESAFIGAAIGAATGGLRPVAELMFIDFMGVCFDQIYNQAAKFRYMFGGKAVTPVVIRTMWGAGLRAAAQHSQSLLPVFTHIPGLKVVAPSNPYDAKGLLIQAIRDDDPVIFAEHKMLYDVAGEVPEESYAIPFGEANIVREGGDVTIVAFGRMVNTALEAAEELASSGIEAEVIDPRTTSPLDTDTILESVENTGRLVVVDESNPRCSLASDIAGFVAQEAFGALRAPIQQVTGPHTPVPFADSLEDLFIPDAARVAAAVKTVVDYGERDDDRILTVTMPKWGLSMTTGKIVEMPRRRGRHDRQGRRRPRHRHRQDRRDPGVAGGGPGPPAGRGGRGRAADRGGAGDRRTRGGAGRRDRRGGRGGQGGGRVRDAGGAGRAAAAARRDRRAADLVPDARARGPVRRASGAGARLRRRQELVAVRAAAARRGAHRARAGPAGARRVGQGRRRRVAGDADRHGRRVPRRRWASSGRTWWGTRWAGR